MCLLQCESVLVAGSDPRFLSLPAEKKLTHNERPNKQQVVHEGNEPLFYGKLLVVHKQIWKVSQQR